MEQESDNKANESIEEWRRQGAREEIEDLFNDDVAPKTVPVEGGYRQRRAAEVLAAWEGAGSPLYCYIVNELGEELDIIADDGLRDPHALAYFFAREFLGLVLVEPDYVDEEEGADRYTRFRGEWFLIDWTAADRGPGC